MAKMKDVIPKIRKAVFSCLKKRNPAMQKNTIINSVAGAGFEVCNGLSKAGKWFI